MSNGKKVFVANLSKLNMRGVPAAKKSLSEKSFRQSKMAPIPMENIFVPINFKFATPPRE